MEGVPQQFKIFKNFFPVISGREEFAHKKLQTFANVIKKSFQMLHLELGNFIQTSRETTRENQSSQEANDLVSINS